MVEILPYCKQQWLSIESYGLLLLILSAILFSVMGVFLKLADKTGIPSTELVFFRALFQGSIVVIGMLGFRQRNTGRLLIFTPFGQSPNVKKLVIIRGVVGGMGFINYYYAMKSLPLGDAITIFSLYPILTIFLARCILKETIRCHQVIAALSCVFGAALIAGPSFLRRTGDSSVKVSDPSNDSTYFGYLTAIFGSFFGAMVVVLVRKAGKMGVHTLQLLSSWSIFGMLFSFVLGMSAFGKKLEGSWKIPRSNVEWFYLIAMASTGSMAHFISNYAMALGPAGLSAIAKSSDIVWAYVWEIFIFHQIPTLSTSVGVILIVLPLIGLAIQKFHEERTFNSRVDNNKVSFPSKTMIDEEKGNMTEVTSLLQPG